MGLKKAFIAACLCAGLMGPVSSASAPQPLPLRDSVTEMVSKKKRALTAGEIDMARSIFGNSIDYERVKISRGHIIFTKKKTARAPANTIFMAARYVDDYSKADASLRRLFIHEMAHVWQSQNKVQKMLPAAVGQWVANGFKYSRAYHYELDASKDLTDYKLEQQAEIIEDYFAARDRTMQYFADIEKRNRYEYSGRERPRSEWISKEELWMQHRAELDKFESVLKNFLSDPSYARDWVNLSKLGRDHKRAQWQTPPAL